MRIAQIAPLFEAVPPKLYGGTERVVHALTEELVAMGHDVTLFASGDSVTSAKLDAVWPRALRLDPTVKDWISAYMRMMELVRRRADEFDVLHFHVDYFPSSLFSRQATPFLTTVHGRLDLPEYAEIYNLFPDVPMVSISDNQRLPLPGLGWVETVPHGIPETLLMPQPGPQDYLAFLGRISPEKGIEAAIRIAGAGRHEAEGRGQGRCRRQGVFRQSRGALAEGCQRRVHRRDQRRAKAGLPGRRPKALLFPIDWPEPFGLVMIESMACGCPVIAFRRGSVPEVMDHGITGFIVDDEDEAVAALAKLPSLDRDRRSPPVREALDRAPDGRGLPARLRPAGAQVPPAASRRRRLRRQAARWLWPACRALSAKPTSSSMSAWPALVRATSTLRRSAGSGLRRARSSSASLSRARVTTDFDTSSSLARPRTVWSWPFK